MSVRGLGTDLVSIPRMAALLERHGARFRQRVFRPSEIPSGTVEEAASRWAAKEACSKALGTGLRMGIAWKDMGVVNLRSVHRLPGVDSMEQHPSLDQHADPIKSHRQVILGAQRHEIVVAGRVPLLRVVVPGRYQVALRRSRCHSRNTEISRH